ncbi:MAG: hypothetical protein RIC55_21595 [Pirellulaceae bacterium]
MMRWTAAFACAVSGVTAMLLMACALSAEPPQTTHPRPVHKNSAGERSAQPDETPADAAPIADAADRTPAETPARVTTGSAAADPAVPDAVIDDIRRIRQRLNLDLLNGTSLAAPTATTNDAGASTSDSADRQSAENSQSHLHDDSEFAKSLRQFAPRVAASDGQPKRVFYQSPPLDPPDDQYLATLREAARQLAYRAESLEQQGDYTTADRLRRLARGVRRESRGVR